MLRRSARRRQIVSTDSSRKTAGQNATPKVPLRSAWARTLWDWRGSIWDPGSNWSVICWCNAKLCWLRRDSSSRPLPRFCNEYSKLAAAAATARQRLWKVTPKLHLFSHLCEWQSVSLGNPRFYWCYSDEDMVGQLVEVAESCHPEHHVNHGAFQVVEICVRGGYRGLTHCFPFLCRQKPSHNVGHRDTKHAHDASPAANIPPDSPADNRNTHIVIDTQTLTHIVTHSQTIKYTQIRTDTQGQRAHITAHPRIVPDTQIQNTHITALPQTTRRQHETHIMTHSQTTKNHAHLE